MPRSKSTPRHAPSATDPGSYIPFAHKIEAVPACRRKKRRRPKAAANGGQGLAPMHVRRVAATTSGQPPVQQRFLVPVLPSSSMRCILRVSAYSVYQSTPKALLYRCEKAPVKSSRAKSLTNGSIPASVSPCEEELDVSEAVAERAPKEVAQTRRGGKGGRRKRGGRLPASIPAVNAPTALATNSLVETTRQSQISEEVPLDSADGDRQGSQPLPSAQRYSRDSADLPTKDVHIEAPLLQTEPSLTSHSKLAVAIKSTDERPESSQSSSTESESPRKQAIPNSAVMYDFITPQFVNSSGKHHKTLGLGPAGWSTDVNSAALFALTLPAPAPSAPVFRCNGSKEYHPALDVSQLEHYQLLHPMERRAASLLRLQPGQYFAIKRRLLLADKALREREAASRKLAEAGSTSGMINGPYYLRRSEAQKMCRVDVNKVGYLLIWFRQLGWVAGPPETDVNGAGNATASSAPRKRARTRESTAEVDDDADRKRAATEGTNSGEPVGHAGHRRAYSSGFVRKRKRSSLLGSIDESSQRISRASSPGGTSQSLPLIEVSADGVALFERETRGRVRALVETVARVERAEAAAKAAQSH